MATENLLEDLRLAHMLADRADQITMARFRAADLRVEMKSDETAVTDADRATEEALRHTLAQIRPRDAFHGEEEGDTGWGPRRWIIDPIDGTANYLRGVPVWATLIALEVEGEITTGVVSAPALHRRWWASKGNGAFAGRSLLSADPIHVSTVDRIEDAFLTYSDVASWVSTEVGQEFVDLMRSCERSRGFGDFWSYMLVAEGVVDIATEPRLALHDMAAPSIVVSEAGGRFTDLDGRNGPYGDGALASNGLLHDTLVDWFADVEYTGEVPHF